MTAKKKKKVSRSEQPEISKHPRVGKSFPINYDSEFPVWQISNIDTTGKWGWHHVNAKDIWNTIHARISNFESMTWDAIKKGGSHNVAINELVSEAQKRLKEIQQSDIDELFSLRVASRQRIWGIRSGSVLKILWWDPKHEVCPSIR